MRDRRELRLQTMPPSMTTENFRPSSLLCLPDEAIALIFTCLNASDTTGILLKPRHAFALALTNTRLLRMFTTHLTRIVPCLDPDMIYVSHPEVSQPHLLSVIRIAGHSLRELHVPSTCLPILSDLPQLCPRVETLVLQQDVDDGCCDDTTGIAEIAQVFRLPLRSLSIHGATGRALELLPGVPQEFSLLDVCADCVLSLRKVLHNPPKKIYLDMVTADCNLGPDGILGYLRTLCPEIEEFTLLLREMYYERYQPQPLGSEYMRAAEVSTLLNKPRLNTRSRCRKMVLEGHDATDFVQYAHPSAHVEITLLGQTFVSRGDGIYPTRIPLWDEYLTQDLSQLTHVFIGEHVNPRWNDLLPAVHLTEAKVASTESLRGLLGKVDTIEIDLNLAAEMDWSWINGAKEVRLVGRYMRSKDLLELLARLLDQFQGQAVTWRAQTFLGGGEPLNKEDYVLRSLVSFIRCALDNWEARGSDARMIRYIMDNIRWIEY